MSDETNVLYKVLADFSALSAAKNKAKKDINDLRRAEAKANKESLAEHKSLVREARLSTKALNDQSKATQKATKSLRDYAAASRGAKDSQVALNRNLRTTLNLYGQLGNQATSAKGKLRQLRAEQDKLNKSMGASNQGSRQFDAVVDRLEAQSQALQRMERQNKVTIDSVNNLELGINDLDEALNRNARSVRRNNEELSHLPGYVSMAQKRVHRLGKDLNNLSRWRPRLIPPFIALVPILGALLGLINPLVAGLGAVATAVFGFGSSLASLSGVILSVVPGLAAIISLVAALKMAFGGIGAVFQKYQAMKDAAGVSTSSGAGQQAELSRTEDLERAQIRYARALQDVKFAQEDLNEAREEYLENIKELRKELEELSDAEGKAQTNALLASEYYAQIADDPSVHYEDKIAAKEYADELAEQAKEATDERKQAEKDLKEAQGDGVEQDRTVIMAKRRLVDAEWAVRDAELDLINTQNGVGEAASAAATAANAFNQALNDLSPSARRVVLDLLDLKSAWEDVQRAVQESYFSQIVDDVKELENLFGPLQTLLTGVAEAAGGVTSDLITQVTGEDWQADISGPITETSVALTEEYGAALGNILQGLKDLAVAAGPFAIELAESFREATESFAALVSAGRESGDLQDWLSEVHDRLQDWWTIVKNIGLTLFNYGAASKEFGDWLTSGFIEATEGWREASERAREEGSSFQTYLENIKPLLSAVSDLFGDFFGWLARISQEESNITKFTGIIERIRTELGPALSRILDILSESSIADSLITALGTILEFIGDLLEKGGVKGFERFFQTVNSLFEAFSSLVEALPAEFIEGLATSLAVISALTFLGLDNVLLTMARVLGSKTIASTIKDLKALGAVSTISGALGGGVATRGRGAGSKVPTVARGLVGGGLSLAGLLAGSAISDGQGGGRDIAGAGLESAAVGAMVASIIPGVGTILGAVVAGVAGALMEHQAQYVESGQMAADIAEIRSLAPQVGITEDRSATEAERREARETLSQASPQAVVSANALQDNQERERADSIEQRRLELEYQGYSPSEAIEIANSEAPTIEGSASKAARDYETAQKAAERYAESGRIIKEMHEAAAHAAEYAKREEEYLAIARERAAIQTEERQNIYLQKKETKRRAEETDIRLVEELNRYQTIMNDTNLTASEREDALAESRRSIERAAEDAALATNDYADAVLAAGGTQEEANTIIGEAENRFIDLGKEAEYASDILEEVKVNLLSLQDTEIKVSLRMQADFNDFNKQVKEEIRKSGGNAMHIDQAVNTGGMIRRSAGGGVPGRGVNDSVSAYLTPGEFVMRRSAVNKYGSDLMSRMNAGAATPADLHKVNYGISHFNTGGNYGPAPSNSTSVVNSGRNLTIEKIEINNPVGRTSEESITAVHDEIAFKYGF